MTAPPSWVVGVLTDGGAEPVVRGTAALHDLAGDGFGDVVVIEGGPGGDPECVTAVQVLGCRRPRCRGRPAPLPSHDFPPRDDVPSTRSPRTPRRRFELVP